MQRAFSLLTVKSVDEEQRVITGIASTPTADRVDDIVEPLGARFKVPMPLLLYHQNEKPVGTVDFAKPTKSGIPFRASLPNVREPGIVQDRVNEAWHSLKYKLIGAVSIGFKPVLGGVELKGSGLHYKAWEWLELSLCAVPANPEAVIQSFKSMDPLAITRALGANQVESGERERTAIIKSLDGHQHRAASGMSGALPVNHLPGVSGVHFQREGKIMSKSVSEQISAFEAKRAATVARMSDIMSKAGDEGRTLDETETQEYDGLEVELKAIDAHIVRMKAHEASVVKSATVVPRTVDPDALSAARGGVQGNSVIAVRPNVEKGIAFTRYVKALAISRGNLPGALAIAEHNQSWKDTTPQVIEVLKAAVAGGDTTTSGWASQLVYNQNMAAEFIELLRPATIIGRLPGLTRVPFNVRMGGQDQGSSAYWVGQGKPVPVSKLNFLEVTLGIAKAAGLVVLTDELVRSSEPSAELLVRNDLTKSIAQFLDAQFVDPNFAEVTNVSPASITNGVTPVSPTGTTSAHLRADVQTLFATYIQNNVDMSGACWIMTPTRALSISLMLNALGQPVFPTMSMTGGTFMGLPVVVSLTANIAGSPASGDMMILCNCPDILFADDGQVTIDASREASVEMLDNPTNDAAAGGPTTMVSMFQTNSVAIKAVRFINWKKRRSTAVAYIRESGYIS